MPTSEHVRGMRNPAWGTSGVRMVSAWMNARIGTCDLHAFGVAGAWGRGTMPWPGYGPGRVTRYGVHRIRAEPTRTNHDR
jgi:hypothetical protein